jgi:hypothetical protein
VELEDYKNVVYAVECETCGVQYIGETGQHFCDRRNQHQRDIRQKKLSNGFYDHLERNEGHVINWEKVRFSDKKKNWKGRKIKETIYINAVVPTSLMNERNLMYLEKGHALDLIWSEFNPVIWVLIQGKLKKTAI